MSISFGCKAESRSNCNDGDTGNDSRCLTCKDSEILRKKVFTFGDSMVSAEAGVLLEISYFYNREGKVEKLLARSEKQGWTEPFSNSLFHKDSTWIKSKENITLTHRNGSKLKKPLVLTKDMDSLDQLRSAIDESYPYNHYDKVDTLIRCSKGNFLDRLLMGLGIDL